MSDPTPTEPAPETAPAAHPQPQMHAEDEALLAFIAQIKATTPIEEIRESLRVTPKGLIVEQSHVDSIVARYQAWFQKRTGGEVVKSLEKIKKRLFGGDDPPLQLLSEGKTSFAGYLAPCAIQQPQKYQLPFYLGSLADTSETLHPKDPVFATLRNVEAAPTPTGLEIRIKHGADTFSFTTAFIKQFTDQARYSPRTMREYPKLESSVSEALRAFVALFEKSRLPRKDTVLFLPQKYLDSRRFQYRTLGSFVFIADKRGVMQTVCDLRGKNLYFLVRLEMAALPAKGTKRIGSFEIYSERHHYLGAFHLRGREVKLAPRVLVGFIEALDDSPDKRDNFKTHFGVAQAFERLSTLYQTSQPISPHLISSYVDPKRAQGMQFLINGSWIFGVSRDGTVEQCIAKHLGIRKDHKREERRGGRRPRRG